MALTQIDDRGLKTPIDLLDNEKIRLGTGNDLELFHDGSNSYIDNKEGDLYIRSTGTDGDLFINVVDDIVIKTNNGGTDTLRGYTNGGVDLYFDGTKRFATHSEGTYHYGHSTFIIGDEGESAQLFLHADDGDDDADKWKIVSAAGGNFYLQNYTSGSWESNLIAYGNGAVELYHDNSKKIETTSSGTTTTGDGYLTGRLLVGTTTAGESNGDEATFANTGGNAGITIRSAVDAEAKIYFSEGTSGGSQYRGSITYSQNNNYMSFGTNENERVRITSSGGIRIGDTYDPYSSVDDVLIATSGDTGVTIRSGTSSGGHIVFADGSSGSDRFRGFIDYKHSDDSMRLGTNDAERLRIDSSGGVRIGNTTNIFNTAAAEKASIKQASVGNALTLQVTDITGGYPILYLYSTDSTASQNAIVFYRGGVVGTITTSASSTAYNTTSDYRLKENAKAISDGITRLKTLKPYRFNWKIDKDTTVDGFFAHEVTAVPEAVTGTKDEISTDENGATPKGDPIYQSIDHSKLVPLLTAALQEAITKIETLETKVAALEAA